ncbi:hypothetical protein BD770DRAFT_449692 [Pilaira anomala]|nr:hypothetical protein BD770DRAFT_449692 [Pilaira anomala]
MYRYEGKYTFSVAVFYGNTKSNYDSFFKPMVGMFKNLSVNPIEVKQDGQIVATANIYSVMSGGDMAEVDSLLKHMGAVCFYGCRFCDVRGSHPGDKSTSNGGMYFSGPKGNDRTKESLLLNKSSFSNDECHGIKGKTVFFNLVHFLDYFGFDELHCYSNLAKQLFEMFSPSTAQHAINSSSKYIPAGTFSGSFAGQNFDNQKGNYRSVDWISWLVHIVPLLIAPFCPPDCKDAISALCHGLQVSLQWCITPEDLYDIKNSFSTWFNYLNKCLVQKMISRTVFRANMHLLLHVPNIIRRMGSMERGIGKLKREEKERSVLSKPIYLEHPLEEGLPKLWVPFASSYNTEKLKQEIDLKLAYFQEAAYFNTAIPTVSFVKVGTRDHVVFDACDIETLVGLVHRPKRDVLTELSSH